MDASDSPLLCVEHLCVEYARRRLFPPLRKAGAAGAFRAVDDVSFTLARGRTLGIVGESGCGKSTVARAMLRLVPATSGRILFDGRDLLTLDAAALRRSRRELQLVFQDPGGSLNPRMCIEKIVGEPLLVHRIAKNRSERRERVRSLLQQVGLGPDAMLRFPDEFSGGQKQRIGLARALATDPQLLILDEPVSALDVSVQGQILNLLLSLQAQRRLTYILIAHNLAVVQSVCDTVAVMRQGRIVEYGESRQVLQSPRHPYTAALLDAVVEPERLRRPAQVQPVVR